MIRTTLELELPDFERVFIIDRPSNTEVAQAAIFVLGNADDKVVSTGGTGDRFELNHKATEVQMTFY